MDQPFGGQVLGDRELADAGPAEEHHDMGGCSSLWHVSTILDALLRHLGKAYAMYNLPPRAFLPEVTTHYLF